MRRGHTAAALALAALAFATPPEAAAQAPPVAGETPLANVLQVLVVGREVLAIDAEGGGQTVAKLRLHESVSWSGARGKVGVVLTDQRILAATTGSAAWQESDYQRGEVAPAAALLGERVALVVTDRRVVGFNGGSGNFVEYRFGPRERVIASRTGENAAVVVTDRKAVGLSPFIGGFFAAPIDLGERIEAVTVDSNVATVTSHRRLLIFRATSGTWEQRLRDLR